MRTDASISRWHSGFNHTSIHVESDMDEVTVYRVFSEYLDLSVNYYAPHSFTYRPEDGKRSHQNTQGNTDSLVPSR
jgi:hypothetical protein